MRTILHIPTIFIELSNGDFLYPFFYQLAMFTGILWLLYEGIRRRFPIIPWTLSIAILLIFIVAGTKISAWNLNDFQALLSDGTLPDLHKKSSLGGFAGGFIALILCKRLFRFDDHFFDAFALFPMLVMFIQRLGCLSAGCCYGTPLEQFGLGVHYFGAGKLRNEQLEGGLLQSWQWTTEAVHAVPVYLMMAAAISAFIVLYTSPRLKNAGSAALLGLICMSVVRFFIEFVRDPSTNHALGAEIAGLKIVQWIGLMAIFFLTGWFIWNEKRNLQPTTKLVESNDRKTSLILVILSGSAYLLHPYFSAFEKVVVFAMLLIALAVMAKRFLFTTSRYHQPLVPAGFAMIALVMMSQTFRHHDDTSRFTTVFKLNHTYQDMIIPEYPYCIEEQTNEGCNGPVTQCVLTDSLRPLGSDHFQNNLSFETLINTDGKVDVILGGGVNNEIYRNKAVAYNENFNQVFAEVGVDAHKYFGIKLGAQMGKFPTAQKISAAQSTAALSAVVPHFQIWVGNKEHATIELYSFMNSLVSSNIMSRSRITLNANLNHITEGRLGQMGIGYEVTQLELTRYRYFMKSEIHLPQHWSIVPQIGYTNVSAPGFRSKSGYTGGLGIRYDLQRK
jgi:hypothetical protein